MRGMYDKLPHNVYINNEKFIINTDFRIFVDFEYEMQEIDRNKAVNNVLKRFYPAFSLILEKGYLDEAIDKFLWFYLCGRNEEETYQSKKGSKENIYSYRYDDLYIWGAYWLSYRVDLTKDNIHWWKFKAMWLSLPDEVEFNKIKGYRCYKGKDKDILELKERYKLPTSEMDKEDRKRRQAIYESLKKGA